MRHHPIGLRLIIIERIIAGTLLILVSLGLFSLIRRDVAQVVRAAAHALNLDVEGRLVTFALARTGMISPSVLVQASVGSLLVGALDLVQAYGLYRQRKWAEYLTAIAIGIFIPFEVYSLIGKVTLLKVVVLAVNTLIVWYLLKHTELFSRAPSKKVIASAAPE